MNSEKNIICLIQARVGSSRLPGKVMKKINGFPMIHYSIRSLSRAKLIDKTIVVTSKNKNNNALEKYLSENNIECFRGSEENVLERYYLAAKKYGANLIVRITGDCPLIDYKIVDRVIKEATKETFDYVSNVLLRTFPRGYDVEVFTFDTLKKMYQVTKDPDDLEHVTLYIRRNPHLFKTKNISAAIKHPEWRLCVDTKQDINLITKIFELSKKEEPLIYRDIINIFNNNPELIKINAGVEQKKVKNETF